MSVYAGPEFNESGLVYYHDMNNKKSYAGAPTTNHVPNADTMPGWATYGGTPVAFQTEFGTTGYRMTNAPSWNGIYRGITIPSTGVYTFSVWARYLGGSVNNNGGGVYISGWGGSDSASVTNRTQIGQWQRLSITLNCTTTSMTFYLISYGGTNDGNSDRSSWEVTMPQAEAGSVATTFVSGTRSNTQVLRDLTGLNTVTASSLTYNTNNTFSFNGSSSFLSMPNSSPLQVSDTFTINVWINPTDLSTNRFGIFSTRTINTTGSWQIEVGVGSAGQRKIAVTGIGTWIWESANDVITTNTWHNICFVKPNNATQGGSMYLNGNLLSPSATTAYTILNNSDAKVIGQGTGGGQFFPGNIGVLQLYNRALTAAEVYSNYTALRLRYGI